MYRYEVSCKTCGVVAYKNTRKAADVYAQFSDIRHKGCGGITIYDRLAHYGRPDLWSAAGSLLHVKEAK